MRRTIHYRLERLEATSAMARQAPDSSVDTAAVIATLRERLRARGFEQLPHESFAETMGRAFGMSGRQLDAYLMGGAYGH